MNESFKGKCVIVTGGGRGIGRSIAEEFAAAGACVVIATRTASYGDEAVAAIREKGGEASLVQMDLSDKPRIAELVAYAAGRHGRIDIVVHCAADVPHGGLDVTDEALDRGIDSIVKAAFWLTREARPHLRRAPDGGRMVFITSICGPKIVLPGRIAYGVCKSALEAFVRGAALELAAEGITVNGIEPGMIASARPIAAMGAEAIQAIGAKSPVGRAGTPEEIAHAVMYLASARSGYVTGASIVVDGGSTLSIGAPAPSFVDHRKAT
jgi:3-oxoacyl-[acyl-carrier protein] reductase